MSYRIEYYPDNTYLGNSNMQRTTPSFDILKKEILPEVVEADDVNTKDGFVFLTGDKYTVVKLIPVNRVKAITRI